jgi:HEAT repeat protein
MLPDEWHANRIKKSADATLGAGGGREAIPRLREALTHRKEDIRRAAAWSLGEIGDASTVRDLTAALQDRDALVRRNAIAALGKIGDKAAVPRLIDLLADDDPRVRSSAVEVLAGFDDTRAVPHLIELLADDSVCGLRKYEELNVNDLAAMALEKLGTDDALVALDGWQSSANRGDDRQIPRWFVYEE